MGAVAAFFAGSGKATPDVVQAMSEVVPHRGRNVHTLVKGRCALACSNQDDFVDAHVSAVDGVAAAFVGTLDNPQELSRYLEVRRAGPCPKSPAALVAAGYQAYGERFAEQLRGVFAGIVTNGEHVLCFRDHLGYGLLFYRYDGGDLYAATEAKQVVAGAGIPREPDLDVVERIFFNRTDDEMPCALRGVLRLPKAHTVVADGGGIRLRRYWKPELLLETAEISDEELHARFEELMGQAVSRCLTGQDVISLSGGIDSPAVAAFAAPRHLDLSGRPLQAMSAVYPRFPGVDERRYVEPLARHFRIPLHTFEQKTNVIDGLSDWVALADGPYLAASLAHYEEDYRLARDLGFRSILTGEHAEFVFALNWYLIDHLLTHGRLGALRRQLALRRASGNSLKSLVRQTAEGLAPASLLAARERRSPFGLPAWIDVRKASEGIADGIVSPRSRWPQLQLSAFIGPGVSAEAEAVCQAVCGVQVRRPWTDVDLFELFLSLPAEQKFPDTRGKNLVRRLLRGHVPDEILDRRDKTVFDEALLAEIDYPTLRHHLDAPQYRLHGVNYDLLGERLRREDFGLADLAWSRNLATVHAFLAQW